MSRNANATWIIGSLSDEEEEDDEDDKDDDDDEDVKEENDEYDEGTSWSISAAFFSNPLRWTRICLNCFTFMMAAITAILADADNVWSDDWTVWRSVEQRISIWESFIGCSDLALRLIKMLRHSPFKWNIDKF